VSVSQQLDKETKEMESRLAILQDRLKSQQLESDKSLTTSGSTSSKWKSSNLEKGSIRSYGKEVTEKFKKRIVTDGTTTIPSIAPSVGGNKPSASEISSNFATKGKFVCISHLTCCYFVCRSCCLVR
jgi:hypothetical protein